MRGMNGQLEVQSYSVNLLPRLASSKEEGEGTYMSKIWLSSKLGRPRNPADQNESPIQAVQSIRCFLTVQSKEALSTARERC